MTPAAVDLIKLTQLEPPAPSSTAPQANAPSFDEHLRRAERRTSDDGPTAAEERSRESTTESASPSDVERADEQAEADSAGGARDAKPTKPDDERSDEHSEIEDDASAVTQAEAQAAPIAAAVPVVQPEVRPEGAEAPPEPVVAEEPQVVKAVDKPTADASPQTKLPAVPGAVNVVAAAMPPSTDDKRPATSDADEAQSPTDAVQPESEVLPVERPASVEVKAKPAESARREVAPTPAVAAKPETAGVVAPPTTEEVRPEGDSEHGRNETKTIADGTPEAPTAVMPGDAPVPNLAPAATADVPIVSPPTVDESKPAGDSAATSKATDDVAPTARLDRSHVAEPRPPAAHREFGVGRSSTSESAASLSQSDRLRLVQRVARAVQTAVERGGDLKLRLSPPELGSLRLQVRLTDGALSARIETDNPAAKQVLLDNLPALRDRLADQNIRVEKFDVDLSNSGGGGASQTPQQPFDGAGDRGAGSGSGRATRAPTVANEENSAARTTAATTGDGRLNVVV